MNNSIKIFLIVFLTICNDILQAKWLPIADHDIGAIKCLIINGNNIYAGTETNGVILSTDQGVSWLKTNDGLTNLNVHCLLFRKQNLFAGTSSGLFFSTNKGSTWKSLKTDFSEFSVTAIAIIDSNILVGTDDDGMWLSANDGIKWLNVCDSLESKPYIYTFAVNGSNIYAGEFGGVFQSTNKGISWTLVGMKNSSVRSLNTIGSYIYAGTEADGVYLSTNSGNNWSPINNGLLRGADVFSIIIYKNKIYAGTDKGVYCSTNYGTCWEQILKGLNFSNVESLTISGDNILVGGDGIYVTNINNLKENKINLLSFISNIWKIFVTIGHDPFVLAFLSAIILLFLTALSKRFTSKKAFKTIWVSTKRLRYKDLSGRKEFPDKKPSTQSHLAKDVQMILDKNKERRNVLLISEAMAGKTYFTVNFLKKLKNAYVLIPNYDKFDTLYVNIPRAPRNAHYKIILLDDICNYFNIGVVRLAL